MIRLAASVLGLLANVSGAAANPAALRAVYSAQPVAVDGKLDDAIWAIAPGYPLALSKEAGSAVPSAGATVHFAWDRKYFYVAVRMADDDVVTESDADGQWAYRLGDVLEMFLKPAGRPGYWEFYATPNGHQTTFFWPSGGRRLPSGLLTSNDLIVAARVQGTLNDPADRDRGWTAEMAVPLSLLEKKGAKFGPREKWSVLIGRYNYSIYLPALELSTLPSLSKMDFHLTDEYAPLTIEDADR